MGVRASVSLDDDLRRDAEIIASTTGDSLGGVFDKAMTAYVNHQEPKLKTAIEAARKART